MDIPALIELIQDLVPDALSDAQIDEIRVGLASDDNLTEALAAELSAQAGAEGEVAPALASFDDVMARIEALGAGLRSQRRRALAIRWTLVLALTGAVVLAVWLARPAPEETPDSVADPASNREVPTHPARTRLATRSATRPTTRLATRPVTRPTTAPAWPDGVGTPSRMTWQEFILPDYKRELSDWQKELSKLFLRLSGKDPGSSRNPRSIEFDGTYRLGSVPTYGRMLRMGFLDGKQFDVDLWSGNKGVRLQMVPDQSRIVAVTLARKDPRSPPTVTGSYTDRGAWRWYGRGAIDLRYQDNRILVCRGEVPLFSVAMPGPPTEGSVKASRVRMWTAEIRPCRKLALPPKRPDTTTTTRTAAGELTWSKQLQADTQLTIEQGKVVLSGDGKRRTSARAWFELDLPPLTALEVTIHVSQCTPMAGVLAQMGGTQRPIFVYKRGRDRVITGAGDAKTMDEDVRAGRTVGDEFWVRVRFGLDVMTVWISPDGKRWWMRRRYPSSSCRTGRVQVFLELQRGQGLRRIAVNDITIRRLDAIRRMAGVAAPAGAAAASALTDGVINVTSRIEALAAMEKARPEQVDPRQWQTACDVVLACRARHWQVRGAALRNLFLTRCYRGADDDVQAVLAALEELLETAVLPTGELSKLTQAVFTGLGRSCIEAGKREAAKAVMDASYLRPGSAGLPAVENIKVVSAGLLRMYLLDLMARGEWEAVRLEAARAMFIGRTRHQHSVSPLAQWAMDEAQSRLGEEGDGNGPRPSIWRHPLAVSDDPDMMNILGEFLFLVRKKQYEAACKVLTSRTLPNALVATESNQEILQTSHFKIRQIIHATPPLGLVLQQARYRQIGMIRLERARRQNDLETLRSLAVQFTRTEPGLAALSVLADRDLSNGDFSRAAARYRLLQESDHDSHRDDTAAKFRLASAMMGKLAGKPATRSVNLPGGTFSPEEFERMIEQLASARNRSTVAAAHRPGPGPAGAKAQLTHLADSPGKAVTLRYPQARPGDLALDGDRVLVSHVGKLFAVDWRTRKVLWSLEGWGGGWDQRSSRPPEERVRLLRVGQRLYVRCVLPGRPLACFDTRTGKPLWSKVYDDRVLSDPILIGPWVSVISARDSVSGTLQLQRVSPSTGEASLSSRPIEIRDSWPSIGRPAVVGDSLLFRTAGCLIRCDLRGEIQWARRLPLVPNSVMPETHTGTSMEDMLVWRDRDVIFTARGCPYVMCVSAESGKVLWSFMISSPARLVGPVAGNVIVVEPDRICALDPETGKIRWQRRHSRNDAAVMPADDGALLVVRLVRPRGGNTDTSAANRYVRWMSAANGRTILEIPVIGDGEIYGVSRLLSDGKRIFGLSNDESSRSNSFKVFMIEISP